MCKWLKLGNIISFMKQLASKNEMRVLLLGLDSAGKTSILFRLKIDELVTTMPTLGSTLGFNVETFHHKDVNFTIWDIKFTMWEPTFFTGPARIVT